MTAEEAMRELIALRQYITPRAIPAVDYALQALEERAARQAKSSAGDVEGEV